MPYPHLVSHNKPKLALRFLYVLFLEVFVLFSFVDFVARFQSKHTVKLYTFAGLLA